MSFATSIIDDAAAWAAVPLVFVVTCFGVGLLAERVLGLRLQTTLLVPTGFCVSVAGLMPGYELGADDRLAVPLLVIAAVAGFVLSRHGLQERLRPGPAAAGAVAVLALYLAPVVLSGGWTWAGYNFLNDTSVQMVLADQLAQHGAETVPGAPDTRARVIGAYLGSGYPLGAHAHLGTLSALLGTGVDVAYQGYLAMLVVVGMLALAGLARRVGLSPRAAAAAGAIGVASNLLYQYALQGSLKEVAAFAAFVSAAALGRELLTSERPVRMAVLLAIACAAMLSAFSSAAGPYLVFLAVALLVGTFVAPGAVALRRQLVPVAAVGLGVSVLASLPTLSAAISFVKVANAALTPGATGASTLGQLSRPLEPVQVAGIWLTGNYSQPIASAPLSALAHGLSYLALALLVVGLVLQLRRREVGVAMLVGATLATTLVMASRASDYADAKLFAVASPIVLFAAVCGGLSLPRRLRPLGLAAVAALAAGALWSDAFAYHAVRLAPVERMQALEDAADHAGKGTLVFHNEVEEFAKYYGRDSRINAAFEAITLVHARPLGGGFHVDLDTMEPGFIQRFQTIILRRGADVSRPPANYVLAYENAFYQVWRKRPGIRVEPEQVSLQAPNFGSGVPDCRSVRELARNAPAGAWLVAAPGPDTLRLEVARSESRPAGWPIANEQQGVVAPETPGIVRERVRAEGGTYDAWVRGSTGRVLIARVDGREVGRVKGINSEGQWLRAGVVRLPPGDHELEIERPGGDLAPGDGAVGQLGPLALVRREPAALTWVRPRDAEQLCGETWDWIEAARR